MPFPVAMINFHGTRSTEGELTWGQRFFWILHEATPREERGSLNVSVEIPVPGGKILPEVLSAVSLLISRHEALRTSFRRSDSGEPRQVVHRTGVVPVSLVEAEGVAGVLPLLDDVLRKHPIDLDEELPIRLALISVRSAPTSLLVIASHLVTDAWGLNIIRRDLGRFLGSESLDAEHGSPGIQPIEQALFESSEPGRAAAARALDYWRAQVSRFPPSMYAGITLPPASPRYVHAALTSPALPMAALMTAQRFRVTPASVVLAAYAVLTSHRSERKEANFCLYSSNRQRVETTESVGVYSQMSPISVETSGDLFSQVARNAQRGALVLYRNGAYPPVEAGLILENANVDGRSAVRLDSVVDIVGDPADGAQLPTGTEAGIRLRRLESPNKFVVHGRYDRADQTLYTKFLPGLVVIVADTSVYSECHIEEFLRGIERVLVAAARGVDQIAELLEGVNLPVR